MGSMSEEPLPPGYPAEWEADVVLRDGTVAHLRPIRPSDVEGIHRFHAGQSDESIYLRFFAPLRRLSDADVHRFTHVDYVDRVALDRNLDAMAWAVGVYAYSTAEVNGVPPRGKRAKDRAKSRAHLERADMTGQQAA